MDPRLDDPHPVALRLPVMRTIQCPRCGIAQNPEKPRCVHMAAAKGGRKAAPVIATKYGPNHYVEIGKKGAAARWRKGEGG